MAYCTINGLAVIEARIALPRVGLWHLDATVDDASELSGAVDVVYGSTTLRGTVARAGVRDDSSRVRVVGGAGGMAKRIAPKSYIQLPLRIPLTDLLEAAGEKLSPSADPALLGAMVSRWTRLEGPASHALASLLERRDVAWRPAADGTIWIGSERWPVAELEHELLFEDAITNRVRLYAEDPTLLPGTTFEGQRVSYIEHHFGAELRTEVWFE